MCLFGKKRMLYMCVFSPLILLREKKGEWIKVTVTNPFSY